MFSNMYAKRATATMLIVALVLGLGLVVAPLSAQDSLADAAARAGRLHGSVQRQRERHQLH